MIDIKTLTEKDIGRRVKYTNMDSTEFGYITSFNSSCIFVRYYQKIKKDGKVIPRVGITSEGTKPEDLTFD